MKTWLFLVGWLFLAAPAAEAVQFSYQSLDDPNASAAFGGTMAQGVSGSDIVGTYFDTNGQARGFLYDGGTYSSLDDSNAVAGNGFGTYAIGISGGEIVGWYAGTNSSNLGFLLSGGIYTTLEDTNDYLNTVATGVSGGNIVGYYIDINGQTHGFLYNGTTYATLDDPSALALSDGTYANGVDGDNVVGFYQSPGNHGFLYDGTSYTTVDYPNTAGFTDAYGISGTNIVGYYADAGGNIHGFLYNGAAYTSFDYPGSSHTYATGISSNTIVGYYLDSNNNTHGFVATLSSGVKPPSTGSLQVTLTPAGAVADGAQWQVDGGTFENSGATVTNLSIGNHTVGFSTISNWSTPANQSVAVNTNATATAIGTYVAEVLQLSGSLQVTLDPAGAASAGAMWQVDGGAFQTSGAIVTNLSVGRHTVSFNTIFEWSSPSNQMVTITNAAATTAIGLYTAWFVPSNGLILLTNGSGTIQHGTWPQILVVGNEYTVTALPSAGNLFNNWMGATNLPYTVVSTSASYTFTMQPGLLLQADFVANPFLTAHGAYQGLFAPANGNRTQTNSGPFNFMLTTGGAVSGNLHLGAQTVPLTGKFGPDGSAEITSKRHGESSLTTALQLDLGNRAVTGTVSNNDGSFIAQLTGHQNVFSSHNPATNYAGLYTLIIPGTTNPATGPYGNSYGTVRVKPSGTISFAGSLADGTPVSQSSVISGEGYWPLYLSLYGGKGFLWSWIYFTNGLITSPSYASWINATNASKRADYRSGFTNLNATVTGGLYVPADQPLLALTSGQVILDGGDLPFTITNEATVTSFYQIIFTSPTNSLTLTINPTTGLINGSFRNPSDPAKVIPINGVLEPGPGNAAGYFPGVNQSGTFTLIPQ